jgi:putative ABC transport system permease protein
MNIMLVSVNERTREIGIKKSIGAKNSDILAEFLIEALIITLFAGIIGMAAGIAVSAVSSKALDIVFILSWRSLMKIFAISFFTGIIFGGYPALIAANQSPVAALRE